MARVTINMEDDLKEIITKKAEEENRSVSNLIVSIIETYLDMPEQSTTEATQFVSITEFRKLRVEFDELREKLSGMVKLLENT